MNTETPLRNRRLPFGTFRGTWLDRVPTLHLRDLLDDPRTTADLRQAIETELWRRGGLDLRPRWAR